jgi:hypothetical protein
MKYLAKNEWSNRAKSGVLYFAQDADNLTQEKDEAFRFDTEQEALEQAKISFGAAGKVEPVEE